MNTAIIVAAGSGQRFGGNTPKQFIELAGKPVIFHTIERFEACSAINEIVLVLSFDGLRELEQYDGLGRFQKVRQVVQGGSTRASSVFHGYQAVNAAPEDLIAIHDGVRPFVTVAEVERTVAKAAESGAACLVGEVTDTIKAVRDGQIIETIDRRELRRALTPQVFRYDLLRRAFSGGMLDGSVTDECMLMERMGIPVTTVEGSSRNIKITRPEDLRYAEAWLQEDRVTV